MNRNELLSQVEKHLIDNQQVSDEAALGLKLLRLTYAELKKPAEAQASSPELLSQLASADRSISTLQDKVADYEGLLYDLLLQVGLLPEVDDEPAISLVVALKEDPECLDKLNNAITDGFGVSNDAVRFIQAVRQLVGAGSDADMHQVYNELESKAQYLAGLEQGIAQRDQQIVETDNRLGRVETLERIILNSAGAAGLKVNDIDSMPVWALEERIKQLAQPTEDAAIERLQSIRAKLGIPADEHGTFEQVEWPAINMLIEQRQAAQDFGHIEVGAPLAGWISDAIDLAHAVRGNLAPENRVMAKAAEQIIVTAPRGEV